MHHTFFAVSARSFVPKVTLVFKHLLLFPLGFVVTATAAAQSLQLNADSYATYAALSEVCTNLVPEYADALRAARHLLEYDNALALLILKTHTDLPTLTLHYRDLMVAADTVFTKDACTSALYAELPFKSSGQMQEVSSAY